MVAAHTESAHRFRARQQRHPRYPWACAVVSLWGRGMAGTSGSMQPDVVSPKVAASANSSLASKGRTRLAWQAGAGTARCALLHHKVRRPTATLKSFVPLPIRSILGVASLLSRLDQQPIWRRKACPHPRWLPQLFPGFCYRSEVTSGKSGPPPSQHW